ncbi:ABC transporter permease [Caldimonas sp. KR1-144]|uniref:ABC transporter permease n=1 Tax=Caldimonas sp. KR1-144 TaxID=3400911 RepID=UPI003C05A271
MSITLDVALAHLTSRKRQTLVSLTGVVLGVAFFLAVSALMRGSERDFIKRLVDNSPHITVYDEVRQGRLQPAERRWPQAAVAVSNVRPLPDRRGIRGWAQRLATIEALPGLRAAPVLTGAAVLTFAGREQGVTLSGALPEKMKQVTTIEEKMTAGSLDDLASDANGIIVGQGLVEKFSLRMGGSVNVLAADGSTRSLRVVGIFRTGTAAYDEGQAFVLLKRAQALLGRENRVNRVIIQLDDPYRAQDIAQTIEAATGYKSVSWIEASEDILSLLLVRNIIMYSVVSAILLVAAFGIYNTISTIVMEKTRDIAIMKSIGFHARDLRRIFLVEGLIVGLIGSAAGVLLGIGLMALLGSVEIRPPGVADVVHLPVWWGPEQYAMAIGFAMLACVGASWLPARRAGRLRPVAILRGAT